MDAWGHADHQIKPQQRSMHAWGQAQGFALCQISYSVPEVARAHTYGTATAQLTFQSNSLHGALDMHQDTHPKGGGSECMGLMVHISMAYLGLYVHVMPIPNVPALNKA